MKERYFIKHLATFLIPLMFPLLILGSLSFFTTQHSMKSDINQSSQRLLLQSKQQLEMILHELDTLKLAMYQNAKVFNDLSTVLQNPSYTYESSQSYQIISSYIYALTASKPYIHSIYFYVENPYNRFISSLNGLSEIDKFNDKEWFEDFLAYEGAPATWTSRRTTKLYEFESTELVTIHNVIAARKIGIFLNIRPGYIENLLRNITSFDGQKLLILDEANRILFSSTSSFTLSDDEKTQIAEHPLSFFDMEFAGGKVNVTKVESEQYQWKYVSIIPHASLYEAPSRILSYTIAFACLSFVGGLLLTYYLTRRNYRQLLAITSLIRSAENDRTPLSSPKKVKDEYSYIIQNMVKHFIEHRYIQTQLSEKKYKLQVMELLALQAQINPHFLYNTLNSIYWESVGLTGKPNRASEMIEDLSDMLSYSFSNPTNRVTWDEEIINTVSYINIQKKRYREKFDVIFEFDEEIRQLHTMKLLLQPLVENALYHGIKEKEGLGLIKIKIGVRGDKLRLIVIDNGVGISKARLEEVRHSLRDTDEPIRHIGLINTNKRLRLMFDMKYDFQIKSKPGLGTAIIILMPLLQDGD
ncbi:sensor histidine kinase [Paenibacillaceae bacterium]|nr:sensor histidine kinase [Paenibacillaceae bacterium]